jgi:hypothetical protein
MLKKQYGKILLAIMLSMAVVPVVSAASAQPLQPTLDASGKICVAVSEIPVPGIDGAVLAVDTYHFTKFKASGVNYGPFDLVVVYALAPSIGHIPLYAFTDNADVAPLLQLVFDNPVFTPVVVGDLDVKIKGMSINEASAEGLFGSLTYTPIPKVKLDSFTLPAGMLPPNTQIVIAFGKSRPVMASGTINGQPFTSLEGFVSIFKMYTL